MQAENVCYKAKEKGYGVIKLKQEGLLKGIKLGHVSGDLTCVTKDPITTTFWGCTYRNEDKTMTIITDSNNEIIFPTTFDGSKDLKFKVPGFNAETSQILVFTNLAYPSYFQKGEELARYLVH